MRPITSGIPSLLATFCLLLIINFSFAQADSLSEKPSMEVSPRHSPTVAGKIIRLAVCEGLLVASSSAASNTKDHGDKIMGWTYAAYSAFSLTLFICNSAKKSNRLDSNYQKNRISHAIISLGISYGLSRIATYNLYQANGDSRNKRFTRNLIENNCAFIVPIATAALVDRLLAGKHRAEKKVQSSVYFDGRNLGLVLTFK